MLITCATIFLATATAEPGWSLVDSGVTTSIRGLSAVDAKVCWLGTKGGVARTIDGGNTWQFTRIGDDSLDFRDLHAFDAKHCIAMSAGEGEASRLYRTDDGGRSWHLTHQKKEPKGFFNGIAFRDEKRGLLAGDPIGGRLFLLVTNDGGASWHRLAANEAPEMGADEHAFAASGTHLAVNKEGHIWVTSGGKVARVFRSTDWGNTWEVIGSPMIAGQPSTGIFSIAFSGEFCIAVGGDYKKESEGKDNAMRSNDGGKTWRLVTTKGGDAPFDFRSCIGFIDSQTLLAVGPSGTDISRDRGKTWETISDKVGFHTLSIAGRTVWAAGADGRVGRMQIPTPD